MIRSFIRGVFGGTLKPSDPRRFLIESMVGAMEADGEIAPEEQKILLRNLEDHELFEGLAGTAANMLVTTATESIRLAGSPTRRVGAIARGLPARTFRMTAYAMAADVVVADGKYHPAELAFLDELATALLLGPDEARQLWEDTRRSGGLAALEPFARRLRELAPRVVDGLMIAATAAGVGQNERRALVGGVAHALLDLQALSQSELGETVAASFDRLRGRAVLEELAQLTPAFPTGEDRFWCAAYMMAVTIACGNNEWREVGFYQVLAQRFGLSTLQLDAAQHIAKQFPGPRNV